LQLTDAVSEAFPGLKSKYTKMHLRPGLGSDQ